MKAPPKSSASSSRVRFSADDPDDAHQGWYRALASRYDELSQNRARLAGPFLHAILRRHAPGRDILDVACGTFGLDMPLVMRGYLVVGRDLSEAMVVAARRSLRSAGRRADVARGDMRSLDLNREFDAILCLGTAFNYLYEPEEAHAALRMFRKHLRPFGVLVLDLTNFDAWIQAPTNARAEIDRTFSDGARVTVFALNDQDRRRRIHNARFIMVVKRGKQLDLHFSEAPLRIWQRDDLEALLRRNGFRVVETWGDLRVGARYARRKSPRLVVVATRR